MTFLDFCKRHKTLLILLILIFIQLSISYSFSTSRFYELKVSGTDAKAFEQLLFNIINGNGITSTIAPPHILQSWLGIHFSPILYLVVPIYYLFPNIETLLLLHSLFIPLAAIPIFYTANIILKSKSQSLTISIFYLINPFVINAQIWDFHEIAFAPFIIASILWSVISKSKIWFIILSIILLATKEHYGLAIFGAGFLWAWYWRDYKFGFAIAIAGLLSFIIVIKIIMPYFSPQNAAVMIIENSEIDRFSWLEKPFSDSTLLIKRITSGIFYVVLLLFPFLGLPILSFVWLLPAIADGIINILANEDMMRHPSAYHSAAIVPVVIIALCMTISKKYNQFTNIKPREILMAVAFATVGFSYCFTSLAYLPANVWELSMTNFSLSQNNKNAHNEIIKMIGDNSSISAQNNILPHIPVRSYMYMFPNGIPKSDYIVLNTTTPFVEKSNMFGIPYFSKNIDKYFSSVYSLLNDKNWGVIFYQDNWLLLRRGSNTNQELVKIVLEKLEQLQSKIEIMEKRKLSIQPFHPQ